MLDVGCLVVSLDEVAVVTVLVEPSTSAGLVLLENRVVSSPANETSLAHTQNLQNPLRFFLEDLQHSSQSYFPLRFPGHTSLSFRLNCLVCRFNVLSNLSAATLTDFSYNFGQA